MIQNRTVTVFGAYGHTGGFVVSELRKRGFTPILSGRDAAKLKAAGKAHPGSEVRVATVNDSASLDRALSGAVAVIHCAGPFIDTAGGGGFVEFPPAVFLFFVGWGERGPFLRFPTVWWCPPGARGCASPPPR